MRKLSLIITAVISVVSIAHATELGTSRASSGTGSVSGAPARASGGYTRITMPERIATQIPGVRCPLNTGTCSIFNAMAGLTAAQRQLQVQEGRRNILRTTQNKNMNINNLHGCRLIRQGTASCYGTKKDGFIGGPTLVGPMNPNQTAAACAPNLRGKVVVIRNPKTNTARAVTCVDTGAFDSKYGRMIDLYASVFDLFGLRCEKDGLMKNMELYSCPNG